MPPQKLQTFKTNTNFLAAEAYARWRGMTNNVVAALKTELLETMKKFYDGLATHCASRFSNASLPKPVESCIDVDAVAAKTAITKSRDKDAQEAQLLPKIIQYDPETAQPMNSQEQRGGPHAKCLS